MRSGYFNSGGVNLSDGTYEAIGPHFQSNPYKLTYDVLVRHGREIVKDVPRSFEGLREYLRDHEIAMVMNFAECREKYGGRFGKRGLYRAIVKSFAYETDRKFACENSTNWF